nr:glycine cleavage system H protein 2, mitochondrial-like [Tanacetum cinerariifolium]
MEGIVFALAFEEMKHIHLCVFPPKSVQVRLKRPFLVHPWIDSEEHVGNLFLLRSHASFHFRRKDSIPVFDSKWFLLCLKLLMDCDVVAHLDDKKMYAHINLNMRSARKPTIFIALNVTTHLLYTIKNSFVPSAALKVADADVTSFFNCKPATIGIADHAQDRSGDLVYVELCKVGADVTQGSCSGAGPKVTWNRTYIRMFMMIVEEVTHQAFFLVVSLALFGKTPFFIYQLSQSQLKLHKALTSFVVTTLVNISARVSAPRIFIKDKVPSLTNSRI